MTTCPACSTEVSIAAKFCPGCGATLDPAFLPTEPHGAASPEDEPSGITGSDSSHHGRFLPGTKLAGRYRIVSLLGKGGMGEVYRADDLRLGHTVALKFLPKELAADPKRLQYFHSEVRLSRQVSHPNVCRVYDI
jgi:serine/threonine-protein kinase